MIIYNSMKRYLPQIEFWPLASPRKSQAIRKKNNSEWSDIRSTEEVSCNEELQEMILNAALPTTMAAYGSYRIGPLNRTGDHVVVVEVIESSGCISGPLASVPWVFR